jgi:hypothetical protein
MNVAAVYQFRSIPPPNINTVFVVRDDANRWYYLVTAAFIALIPVRGSFICKWQRPSLEKHNNNNSPAIRNHFHVSCFGYSLRQDFTYMRRLLSANTLFLCLLDTVIAAQEELYTQRGAAKFYFRATRMIISRSQVGSDIPGILHNEVDIICWNDTSEITFAIYGRIFDYSQRRQLDNQIYAHTAFEQSWACCRVSTHLYLSRCCLTRLHPLAKLVWVLSAGTSEFFSDPRKNELPARNNI